METVKEITDLTYWDEFVEQSPQGTVFSSSKWLRLFGGYHIYGCYKGGEMLGGAANFDELTPLTPYQGVLVKPQGDMKYATYCSLTNELSEALIPYLPQKFYNHWSFQDVRPFKWQGWTCDIRYTYVVDLTDMDVLWQGLEKQTRYEVNHARKFYDVWLTPEIRAFDRLYSETFKRKGLERPVNSELIHKLAWNFNPDIFFAGDADGVASMAVFLDDSKRAYYILGASGGEGHTSSLTLWRAFEKLSKIGCKEVEMVGCNDKDIGLFKRGFGGTLTPYYGVRRV